jgi:hypothetical protein
MPRPDREERKLVVRYKSVEVVQTLGVRYAFVAAVAMLVGQLSSQVVAVTLAVVRCSLAHRIVHLVEVGISR